jgi:molybdopterin-guanine dinucleotide biosynthesis protein A
MGRDKATLIYKDQPLWRNQLDLLRQLNPAELFLSARTDPAWRPADLVFLPDVPPSRGPISGVSAALEAMNGTHLLVLGIDMPFMTRNYLQSLCEKVAPQSGALPIIGGRTEPLAGIYPAAAKPALVAALRGNEFSLQVIGTQLRAAGLLRFIPVATRQKALFFNMNDSLDVAFATEKSYNSGN